MIKAILIDLDDTLADDRFATEQAALLLCRSYAIHADKAPADIAARWSEITDKHWKRYRNGETTLQGQRRARLAELIGNPIADAQADQMFAEYISHYESNWRLVPEAKSFLTATSAIPKIIITNGDSEQAARKVSVLELGYHFSAVVTPELAGVSKPNAGIYVHALNLLGVDARDCLMIGDSYENDIAPALALGMAAFHVGSVTGKSLLDAVHDIPVRKSQ